MELQTNQFGKLKGHSMINFTNAWCIEHFLCNTGLKTQNFTKNVLLSSLALLHPEILQFVKDNVTPKELNFLLCAKFH